MKITIVFTILFLFAFFGMFIAANMLHEMSHINDFSKIIKSSSVCFFGTQGTITWKNFLAKPVAYFEFTYDKSKPEVVEEYQSKNKYSELRAYAYDGVLLIIFCYCTVVAINYLRRGGDSRPRSLGWYALQHAG